MRDFSGFAQHEVATLQDIVHRLTLRCGITTAATMSTAKLVIAVQSAIRSLHSKHGWSYYKRITRFKTSPAQTMSVSYDLTGGAEERIATITSAHTWPTDATYGELWIGEVCYRVLKRISSTQVTLEQDFAPIADYTGEATWKRRAYGFSRQVSKIENVHNVTSNRRLSLVPTGEFNASNYNLLSVGSTRHFSWQNHGNEFGAAELVLFPAPETEEIIEVSASTIPHTPRIHAVTGTDLTGSSGSTTVSCAGGSFSNKLVGSIIRISSNTSPPVAYNSDEYTHQAFITSVQSNTSLTISEPLPAAYASCGYLITSPLDISVSTMLEALEDEAFYQYTKNHNHSGTQEAAAMAMKSLREAMIRDNKTGEDAYSAWSATYDPLFSITEPE